MEATIKAWGNSQGIRIPMEVLKTAGFKVDEVVQIEVEENMIILKKSFRHKTLEERAAQFGGSLNLDGEQYWPEPKGDEIW